MFTTNIIQKPLWRLYYLQLTLKNPWYADNAPPIRHRPLKGYNLQSCVLFPQVGPRVSFKYSSVYVAVDADVSFLEQVVSPDVVILSTQGPSTSYG